MAMKVEAKRTVVSMRDYTRAMLKAWKAITGQVPTKQSIAVLWAQYMIETGGAACWNWNIGNVKHVNGDGHNWHELDDVWEGVSPSQAKAFIAQGVARLEKRTDRIKAVGPNRICIVFIPPYPATLFRAYASLDEAMYSHLGFLQKKYVTAWSQIEAGDYRAFAKRLKEGKDGKENTADDYFTATSQAYAQGMSYHYAMFVGSPIYQEELTNMLAAMEAPTQEQLPTSIPDPPPTVPANVLVEAGSIVHAMPSTLPEPCPRCKLRSCSGGCPIV